MKNRQYWKGLATGLLVSSVIFAAGILGYRNADQSKGTVLESSEHRAKIIALEQLIDAYYLGEKDEEKLADGMYKGLVSGLGDPFSRYYTAEEYSDESADSHGSYEGIGVSMTDAPDGGALIVMCYEGGPAERAGLLPGDIISAINGTDCLTLTLEQISEMCRNSGGNSVELTILRGEDSEELLFDVPIENVELLSVYGEMLEDHIGYIRIEEFKGVTARQYSETYAMLASQGMEKLIVDLRNNPGGYVSQVCDVLREILPEGLIVYTEDKDGVREEERCDGAHYIGMPLAVLVNDKSASAAEIFAGAVQDYGIGTIIGEKTFGKGVVQSIRTFRDGSAVKLTNSHYYTPLGHDINGEGITPDLEIQLEEDVILASGQSHDNDTQLQAAVRVVSAQKVV
ncbi:MAG: S41 family peptidase [Blautia sp.]|nr:S41 family peptidase [Blautia sp.]